MDDQDGKAVSLEGVEKTLLLPLWARAKENQKKNPFLPDQSAPRILRDLGFDSAQMDKAFDEYYQLIWVVRAKMLDEEVVRFLARCPRGTVVNIGAGLDTTFERIDNGAVHWYDLDLPEVIALRRKLLAGERPRYHHLACSALDYSWMDVVSVHLPRPFLFVAEGVLMYLEEPQVKQLVLTLRERFPGSELIADTFTPFIVWANNLRYSRTKIGARCHWGLKKGRDVEKWAEGIELLDEWYPFTRPEPRLARARWVANIPFLARVMGIFHYRLGTERT